MDRIKWVLIVVIRVITFGVAFRPDPNAPIDVAKVTKHKATLTADLTFFNEQLTAVRDEKEKAEEDLRQVEDLIAGKTLKGKARREAIRKREKLLKDIASLEESQVDLEDNIDGIHDDQRLALRYERSKPRERSTQMEADFASMSGRIRDRRNKTAEHRDKARIDDDDATDRDGVEVADDHCDEIEAEIVERREREKAAAEKPAAPEPVRDPIKRVEKDEPPAPPQKQLDFT